MSTITRDQAYAAVKRSDIALLERYLQQDNCSINDTRWSGWSLLHRAAEFGSEEACEFLLQAGADVNIRSTWGWHTPLHLALSNGRLETALILATYGASQRISNKYGLNASDFAVKRGYSHVAKEFRAELLRREYLKLM